MKLARTLLFIGGIANDGGGALFILFVAGRGVDFVMHRVSDLEHAVKFYRDVLGLTVEIHSEEHHRAELDRGNLTLALRAHGTFGRNTSLP